MISTATQSRKMDTSVPNRPKTPVNTHVTPTPPSRSRPNTPKLIDLETNTMSFLKDQPEIEIKPRRASNDRRSLIDSRKNIEDAVTITAVVVKRPKTPQPQPSYREINFDHQRRRRSHSVSATMFERKQEKEVQEVEEEIRPKRRKSSSDTYCWRCHSDGVEATCSACPRSWHRKCIGGSAVTSTSDNWICGECASILKAENPSTRSPLMANLTVEQLCMALKHVIGVMKKVAGCDPFLRAVDLKEVENYMDYVIKPMDLALLENNVVSKLYGSTDAFMADVKWILHNCIVFNTCGGKYADTSKLTTVAKQLIKIARQEVSELEACSSCYIKGRHLPRPYYTWFVEACHPPHPLIWAKLKGFPFWPAKAMPRTNNLGHVDVRFFGEHDRAWVSPKDLFLYSKEPPNSIPQKRRCEMFDCLREISIHIKRLVESFGTFQYAPLRTPYNPNDPLQIKILLPQYNPPMPVDYLLPKKVPTDRVKKSKEIASPSGSASEPYVSDAETTVGYVTEGPEDDEASPKLKRRARKDLNGPKVTEIFLENLPTDLIPGKLPRQCKMIRIPPVREVVTRKRVLGVKDNVKGQGIRGKRGMVMKNAPVRVHRQRKQVLRTRDDLDDVTNKILKEGLQTTSTNSEARKSLEEENELKAEPKDEPIIVEKRQSRAKKSFPNRPPQIVSCVSLQQRRSTEVNELCRTPEKKDKPYELLHVDTGPLSSLLNAGANDVAKQIALIIEETIKDAAQGKGTMAGTIDAQKASIFDLKLKMERMRWQHEQQIIELKQNTERTLREMRASLEAERMRSIAEITKSVEEEKAKCIEEIKGKQWCACCGSEAIMSCCWNTSYCGLTCQELHWRTHYSKCRHKLLNKTGEASNSFNGGREQSEIMPKLLKTQTNSINGQGV